MTNDTAQNPAESMNAAPHPLAQYPYLSPSGQHGWDGQAWVPIPPGSQPSAQATTQDDATATQPGQQTPAMVSNAPAGNPTDPTNPVNHPSVQKAGWIYKTAEALAGGPRYTTSIDPNTGTTTRTPVPMSRGDIGMAIAMEAISGALTGLSQKGPNATADAAAAGFQQAQQQRQQANQQAQEQAQIDAKNQADATVRAANIADINARTLLSTAEAEGRGADTLSKIADTNKSLIEAYNDAGSVQDQHVTQEELLEGMQPGGKYNATAQLGPIDGYRLVGNGKVEATHAVITNPSAKVTLTPEMWKDYADNHVQGFPKTAANIASIQVPGTIIARANE